MLLLLVVVAAVVVVVALAVVIGAATSRDRSRKAVPSLLILDNKDNEVTPASAC